MPAKNDRSTGGPGGGGLRRRVRGMCSGKTGKTIGLASIAAPIFGFVINDLKKPNSVIRALAVTTVRKFLPAKSDQPKAIDITDKVEIVEINDSKTN